MSRLCRCSNMSSTSPAYTRAASSLSLPATLRCPKNSPPAGADNGRRVRRWCGSPLWPCSDAALAPTSPHHPKPHTHHPPTTLCATHLARTPARNRHSRRPGSSRAGAPWPGGPAPAGCRARCAGARSVGCTRCGRVSGRVGGGGMGVRGLQALLRLPVPACLPAGGALAGRPHRRCSAHAPPCHPAAAARARLLALHDVRLGQRLDRADQARGAVPRQRHAPKRAGAQHAPHLQVIQLAALKAHKVGLLRRVGGNGVAFDRAAAAVGAAPWPRRVLQRASTGRCTHPQGFLYTRRSALVWW